MSKVELTKEQKEAISLRNKNIIVSAQAGAGKTHILVERIIELLDEDRIDIDTMLIVTFTNKAAAEMKDRIRFKILDRINKSENEDKRYFQKQYNKISNSNISTMHSFCITVLRDYFYKLGLNPGFKLIKDSTVEVLKWKSMNEVFEKNYKNQNKDFEELILKYSKNYSDSIVIDILFKIYRFIQSQIDPFNWLDEKIKNFQYKEFFDDEKELDNLNGEIFKYYEAEIKDLIKKYNDVNYEINAIFKSTNCPAYQKTLNDDLDIINQLETIKSIDDINTFAQKLKFKNLERIKKDTVLEFGEELINRMKELVNDYRDSIKAYFKNLSIDVNREIEIQNELRHTLETIKKLLLSFDKSYNESKKKINSLDFNDLEHLTIELLNDEEVVEELRSRFNYIFFDEYQDANQVQDYIINRISRKDNLFFVGDIKQSIYKFRLADPILFKNRYETYKTNGENNKAIDLIHNFRSKNILLEFNNMIFNKIMTEEIGDVNYNQKEHRLHPGKKEDEKENKSRISINYVNDDKENFENIKVEKDILRYNSEAYYIAKKIREVSSNGKDFKDIVVLSRTSQILEEISEFLELFNIPHYSDSSKFSYEDVELKVFIEILRAVNNDTEDITLLTALKSTISNITDEELAIIRGEDKTHSFNYCFREFTKNLEKDEIKEHKILKEKINSYYENIEKNIQIYLMQLNY